MIQCPNKAPRAYSLHDHRIAGLPRTSRARLRPDRHLDPPHQLDVVAEDDPTEFVGRAHLAGWLLHGRRPVPTYRLIIGGRELGGLFVWAGRRFERVPA